MLLLVLEVLGGDGTNEGIRRVAIGEERTYGQENFGDRQRRRPVVLQNVEANDAVGVDVAVVNAGPEGDLGRLERVVVREVDVEEEDAAFVDGAGRPEDGRHPLVQVVTLRAGGAVRRRVEGDFGELLLDALGRSGQSFGRRLDARILLFARRAGAGRLGGAGGTGGAGGLVRHDGNYT